MVGNDDSSNQIVVSTWITRCQNQEISNTSRTLNSPLSRQSSPLFGREGVPRPGRYQSIGPDIRGRRGPRKMKHMTCPYWASGHCRYPEPDCLYAHQMTGTMADQPLRVESGSKSAHTLDLSLLLINIKSHQLQGKTLCQDARSILIGESEPS